MGLTEAQMEKQSQLLLVDGMALLFRSFYATAASGYFMFNSKGIPLNAVHGFMKHLLTAIHTLKPSHVICCWDMGSTTFRTEIFEDYKANRGEPPVQLIPQFTIVKEVVSAFRIPNIGVLGAEADDCIGTITKQFREKIAVSILTGDRDLLQLLAEGVTIYILDKGIGNYRVYTEESFIQETGITPPQLIDVKALMGDASDNYPGVKGIGEKTAIRLVQQHGSVDGIIQNIDKLSKAQRQKIHDGMGMLELSRKLAEIHCDLPLKISLEDAEVNYCVGEVKEVFDKLELRGLDHLLSMSMGL